MLRRDTAKKRHAPGNDRRAHVVPAPTAAEQECAAIKIVRPRNDRADQPCKERKLILTEEIAFLHQLQIKPVKRHEHVLQFRVGIRHANGKLHKRRKHDAHKRANQPCLFRAADALKPLRHAKKREQRRRRREHARKRIRSDGLPMIDRQRKEPIALICLNGKQKLNQQHHAKEHPEAFCQPADAFKPAERDIHHSGNDPQQHRKRRDFRINQRMHHRRKA